MNYFRKWAFGEKHCLYGTWKSMMQRCYNKNHKAYSFYGGRGIFVCDRWKNFDNFVRDMNPRPDGMTMDRIDGDGNYLPSNVQWSDKKEQQRNMKSNRNISHDGRSKCLAAWAEEKGISEAALSGRLKNGWSVESALEKPVHHKCSNQK